MAAEPDAALGRDGFAELIGLEYLEQGPELVRARAPVSDRIRQPYGIVHGGAYSAIAESICSLATWAGVWPDGKVAMGQSNNASFLRPISEGHVNATARRRHGGRSSWIWDVEITDDAGRLCALVRMTVAVRDGEQGR